MISLQLPIHLFVTKKKHWHNSKILVKTFLCKIQLYHINSITQQYHTYISKTALLTHISQFNCNILALVMMVHSNISVQSVVALKVLLGLSSSPLLQVVQILYVPTLLMIVHLQLWPYTGSPCSKGAWQTWVWCSLFVSWAAQILFTCPLLLYCPVIFP